MAVLALRGVEGKKELVLNLCFHIIQSEQITLSTDITDHIVEDHTVVQDHITVKPRTFTMRGLISEKIYEHPDLAWVEIPPEEISAKLSPLKTIAPVVNSYVQSAINAYESVKFKVNQIVNIYNNIKSLSRYFRNLKSYSIFPTTYQYDQKHKKWADERIQKEIIELLDEFRINRIPVSINTGWGMDLIGNFYITDITVNQGDTYQLSDLSVTVKELRFTDTKLVKLTSEDANRLSQQSAAWENTVTGLTEQRLESIPHKIAREYREQNANSNGNN